MKMKKLLSLLTATAISATLAGGVLVTGASAEDEANLVAITEDSTFWFDDYLKNNDSIDTNTSISNAFLADKHFYSWGGFKPSMSKNTHSIGSETHYNCLRVKGESNKAIQNGLIFKVNEKSKITFYTYSDSKRGIILANSKTANGYADYNAAISDLGSTKVEPVSQTKWSYTTSGEETLYVGSYGGDFWLAGVEIDIDPVPTYTTTYNFGTDNGAASIGIQKNSSNGETASLSPTSKDDAANAPDMFIDASKVNNAKFNNETQKTYAQINAGTELTIPNVAAGSKISINAYNNSSSFSIAGNNYTVGDTYIAASDGDVVMTSNGSYFYGVTVEGPAFTSSSSAATPTVTKAFVQDFEGDNDDTKATLWTLTVNYEGTVDSISATINGGTAAKEENVTDTPTTTNATVVYGIIVDNATKNNISSIEAVINGTSYTAADAE